MNFDVIWLNKHMLCWDQAQLDGILTDLGGNHRLSFADETEGAVVIVPARYHVDHTAIRWLNNELANLNWVVLMLTSDEESTFPVGRITHPHMRTWIMTPRPGQHTGDRFLSHGSGIATAHTIGKQTGPADERVFDWFFAGQVNHRQRRECVDVLHRLIGGKVIETRGFTQGLDRDLYLSMMASAKIVPCPSGPATPDSFRAWEALEAGALPVVTSTCPAYTDTGYWHLLLGEDPPFPVINTWSEFPGLLPELLADWPANANRAGAWWLRYQRDLKRRIVRDISDLSGQTHTGLNSTVLVPTSSIPAHPDTAMIEETIASIRHHVDSEIVIMCDGIRPEQEHRRADYDEYVHRLLWLCQHPSPQWYGVTLLVFDEHLHQVAMTREAMKQIVTPLVLFVEHDTPLLTDKVIDWPACETALLVGELDTVRFHYEAVIPSAHDYLTLDKAPVVVGGLPVIRTRQWSSRPHLSTVDYYRRLLEGYSRDARSFTEDRHHGRVQDETWDKHKLGIYAPVAENVQYSGNLDGRKGDEKAGCVF